MPSVLGQGKLNKSPVEINGLCSRIEDVYELQLIVLRHTTMCFNHVKENRIHFFRTDEFGFAGIQENVYNVHVMYRTKRRGLIFYTIIWNRIFKSNFFFFKINSNLNFGSQKVNLYYQI